MNSNLGATRVLTRSTERYAGIIEDRDSLGHTKFIGGTP